MKIVVLDGYTENQDLSWENLLPSDRRCMTAIGDERAVGAQIVYTNRTHRGRL